MISRREQEREEGKEEEETRQEKRPGGILVDGESGKKTLLPSLSRTLSPLSHSKEGTQPGLD